MSQSQTKYCPNCNSIKTIDLFTKKISSKDGLQSICVSCKRLEWKEWYKRNKVAQDKKNKERKNIGQQFCFDYAKEHGCVDCGENEPACLDFDHMRGKKKNTICNMVRNGNSISKLKKEISKCEVRCSNCHRKKTAKDFNWYLNINSKENEDKINSSE